jgi:hypothetical protein
VVDGAVWCLSVVELYYGEAVRILEVAHAAEYLTVIAQTSGVDGSLLSPALLSKQHHALKHDRPAAVVRPLRGQLQSPQFVAHGWPIGSGMAEMRTSWWSKTG